MAHLLATHGALAAGKASARSKARNLTRALKTSREIGTTIGIIMANEKVTREEAFTLLLLASQHSHRKLADVAADVADTGLFPFPVGRPHG